MRAAMGFLIALVGSALYYTHQVEGLIFMICVIGIAVAGDILVRAYSEEFGESLCRRLILGLRRIGNLDFSVA